MHVNNAILLERKMESGYFQIIDRTRKYRAREHRARKTNAACSLDLVNASSESLVVSIKPEVTTESRKVERDHGG